MRNEPQYSVLERTHLKVRLSPKEENVLYIPGPGTNNLCLYSGPFLESVPKGLVVVWRISSTFKSLNLLSLLKRSSIYSLKLHVPGPTQVKFLSGSFFMLSIMMYLTFRNLEEGYFPRLLMPGAS